MCKSERINTTANHVQSAAEQVDVASAALTRALTHIIATGDTGVDAAQIAVLVTQCDRMMTRLYDIAADMFESEGRV